MSFYISRATARRLRGLSVTALALWVGIMTQYSGFVEHAAALIFIAVVGLFRLSYLNECRERFGTIRGNLAACGILLVGVLIALSLAPLIKAEHLSREDIYIGMSEQAGFDNISGPKVKCAPTVRKLPPGIELVKTYKPDELIKILLVVGNDHESIALTDALLILNFSSNDLTVSAMGFWTTNEQNQRFSAYLPQPIHGTTCMGVDGLSVRFPKAGVYGVSAALSGHNIKQIHSKFTVRLN